jgi:RimJ/RimL family protein N-acetyltransferase
MLQSSRLIYRLYDLDDEENFKSDIKEIFLIDQDPEVMKFITGGVATTRETLRNIFIPRIKSYTDVSYGYGMWRVALSETDECIGEIIVRPMNFFTDSPDYHDIELGWRFHQKFWGMGYATEAAQTIMDAISLRQEVTHFTAMADPRNEASINIMQKLGMEFVEQKIHKDPLGDTEVVIYKCAKQN